MQKWKFIGKLFAGLIFIFITVYETLITSDIIVPNEVTPFKNLTEIINAGYKIAFFGEPVNDPEKVKERIEIWFDEDYKTHKIHHKMKDTVEYKGTGSSSFYNLNYTRTLMTNVDPKYAYYDTGVFASTSTYDLQRVQILMERVKCFRVEEDMSSEMHYWFFYNHIRQSLKKSIEKMYEFGFTTFWKGFNDFRREIDLRDLSKSLDDIHDTEDIYKDSMITLRNLISLFVICGGLVLLAVLAFAFECRKLRFTIQQFTCTLTFYFYKCA